MELILLQSSPLYTDCTFSSKPQYTLKENDVLKKLYAVGPWLRVQHNDDSGWIYPFNKNKSIIIDKDLVEKMGDYVTGSVVKVRSNTEDDTTYIDKNGVKFSVRNNNTDILFILSPADTPMYYTVSREKKFYIVNKNDIEVVKKTFNDPKNYFFADTLDWLQEQNRKRYNDPEFIASQKKRKEEKDILAAKVDTGSYSTIRMRINKIEEKNKKGKKLSGSDLAFIELDETQKYITKGWRDQIYARNGDIVARIETDKAAKANPDYVEDGPKAINNIHSETFTKDRITIASQYYDKMGLDGGSTVSRVKLGLQQLRSIFGAPYQYLPIADLRVPIDPEDSSEISLEDTNSIGLKYREKILSRMPLMIIQPGIVDFMPNFKDSDKDKMLEGIVSDAYGGKLKDLNELMKNTRSSYYTFYPAWNLYYKYVNVALRTAAIFMGIGDRVVEIGGYKAALSKFSWEFASCSEILSSSFYKGSIAVYLNTETQISESFSNATTQSAIAAKTNSVSEIARELMFVSSSTADITQTVVEALSSVPEAMYGAGKSISNMAASDLRKQMSQQGVVDAVLNGVSNSVIGAKMVFPELWQDSQFSRDFSVSVKLSSPDNDPLSVYLNIIVPMVHMICLAAPKSTGPTTYASPFLIRAFYQGFFNVNMGIITGLSINKGNEGAWTYSNVPTTAELRIDIKDLFATNYMDMTESSNLELNVMTDQPFVDYIANMCGVNIDEPDYTRMLKIIKVLITNKPKDYFNNMINSFLVWGDASYNNTYKSIFGLQMPGLTDLAGVAGRAVKDNVTYFFTD